MKLYCTNIAELNDIAIKILETYKGEKIFAFFGEMGAGKTTLIKELCAALGVKENVCSPTFSIVNEYRASQNTVYHFDFYRIKTPEEALQIGFEEYLYSNEYCFMEWSERIEPLLTKDYVAIEIEVIDELSRKISLRKQKV